MNTLIEQKMKEFDEAYAYKFAHRHGCSSFSDLADGEMCNCGVMDDVKAFLRKAMEEAIKETGKEIFNKLKCKKCNGTGYLTGLGTDLDGEYPECDCIPAGVDDSIDPLFITLEEYITNSQPTK